jgi:hypothetical protein
MGKEKMTEELKLNVKYSECDCKKCSSMCHAPCCGTPDDIEKLMNAGYGNRLMYDNLEGGETMLKPALKGYEGIRSPWETSNEEGCTFWKEGKCELHDLGLKPSQGKLAHHSLTTEQHAEIGEYVNNSWKNHKGDEVIEKWNQINE